MDNHEGIEKYFRGELNAEEQRTFSERLASDPAFKAQVDAEELVHKSLRFARDSQRIRALQWKKALTPQLPARPLTGNVFILVGVMAFAVWFVSTAASRLTNVPPDDIKWVGLGLALVGSTVWMMIINKTYVAKVVINGIASGLIVFVTASGIDAINQGVEGISKEPLTESSLIPFTENMSWWPTQALEDSLEVRTRQVRDMQQRIRAIIDSRLNSGPRLSFAMATGRFGALVVPRTTTVLVDSTYEADIYLTYSPLFRPMDVRVDGKPVTLETGADGVAKGKLTFPASGDDVDASGEVKKKFLVEIKLADSTYRKEVEYRVVRKE
jgi:hypothetical protein